MKAIILAAGMGMRIDSPLPKPLIPLHQEHSILDYLVSHISREINADDLMLVVGYKFQLIMEKFPHLTFVYNHDYVKNGTAKSLLCALRKIQNEDVLWMNGDIYCDAQIFKLMLGLKESGCLVDHKSCGEEEVKYNRSKNGFIHELSKSVKNAEGEALGINLIKAKDLEAFKKELELVGRKDFFEKALENLTLAGKLHLKPVDKGSHFCHEIDFEEDLETVRMHLQKK